MPSMTAGSFPGPCPCVPTQGAQTCVSAHFTNKQETPQHRSTAIAQQEQHDRELWEKWKTRWQIAAQHIQFYADIISRIFINESEE